MSQDIDSKIVRSVKVPLDKAVAGMVLAEDIRKGTGVILPAGAVLKREHIRNLRDNGRDAILIEAYSPPKEFHPLRGKVAVVIDDSPFIRHMFAKLLYRMGVFVAEESETAEDGIRAVRKFKPHLVVMDIYLPGMDGITAMKQLQRTHPGLKYLVVSTDSKKEKVFEAIRAGADVFMAKPIRWEHLKPRVLQLIGDSAETETAH